MKKFIVTALVLLLAGRAVCQSWTDEQLQKANTAADEYLLSDAEKTIIQTINLCRLYPAEFAEKELKIYNGVPRVEDPDFATYKASLLKELAGLPPRAALRPNELLQDDAKCYSNEISKNQRKPHERINCLKRSYAECLYFGTGEGKHIAMQWLIDSGVPTLGHRKICLDANFKKTGVKIAPHFDYGHCAVGEFE